jgi:hypothetical protein
MTNQYLKEEDHPILSLIGGVLSQVGVSPSGDELLLAFEKNGELIHLAVGHDSEGFCTVSMGEPNTISA